jgi:hypothetical protein
MCSSRSCQFPTIWLLMRVGERYKPVDTVMGAAELLLQEWPLGAGEEYLNALQACLTALKENGPVEAVAEALILAADEALICYLSIVKRRTPAGQLNRLISRSRYRVPAEALTLGTSTRL